MMSFSSTYFTTSAEEMNVPSISPVSPSSDWKMVEAPMGDLAYAEAAAAAFPDFKMTSLGYGPVECNPGYFALQVPPMHPDYTALDFNYGGAALPSSRPPVVSPGAMSSPGTAPRMSSMPTPPLVDHIPTPTPFKTEPEPSSSLEQQRPKNHGTKRKQPSPPPVLADIPRPKPQSHLRTAKRISQGGGAAARNKLPRQSPDQQQHPFSTSSTGSGATATSTTEEQDSEVKARAAHNQVEQQYRQRLNAHFERLLAVLPVADRNGEDGELHGGTIEPDRRKVSKAEVLDLARRRIEVLEWEVRRLEKEKREMLLGGSG